MAQHSVKNEDIFIFLPSLDVVMTCHYIHSAYQVIVIKPKTLSIAAIF